MVSNNRISYNFMPLSFTVLILCPIYFQLDSLINGPFCRLNEKLLVQKISISFLYFSLK